MIMKMIKEVCKPCCRTINIGQPILECDLCHTAIHTKCFKKAKFATMNELWVCHLCSVEFVPRYNPFEKMLNTEQSDKFYENDFTGDDATIEKISNVLNLCRSYKAQDFNLTIKQLQSGKPNIDLLGKQNPPLHKPHSSHPTLSTLMAIPQTLIPS